MALTYNLSTIGIPITRVGTVGPTVTSGSGSGSLPNLPLALYRTVTADDAADVTLIVPSIDLSTSVTGKDNFMTLVVKEATSQVQPILVELYANFPNAVVDLATSWYLYQPAGTIYTNLIYTYDKLVSCKFKLRVTNVTPGNSYSLYYATNTLT